MIEIGGFLNHSKQACVGMIFLLICRIEDPNERARIEIQIMEFGQTPKQLFTKPHPPRFTEDGLRHHSFTTVSSSSQEIEGKNHRDFSTN
jgi:factor associated with neutral sphingomyelinase activation